MGAFPKELRTEGQNSPRVDGLKVLISQSSLSSQVVFFFGWLTFALCALLCVYGDVAILGLRVDAPIAILLSVFIGTLCIRWSSRTLSSNADVRAILASAAVITFFTILFFSEYAARKHVYPLQLFTWMHFFAVGSFIVAAWYASNLRFVITKFGHISILSPTMLIACQVALYSSFLIFADGRLIFSDDHPSFLYRLQLLQQHFPQIPFYNTEWNAGYSAHEFFPSGILSYYLLLFPILSFIDLSSLSAVAWYTYLLGAVFIVAQPWFMFCAARIIGISRHGSIVAALFSLAPSLGLFEWLMKYGTLSFVLSCALYPLVFSLCYKVLLARNSTITWKHVAALLISSSLCIFWTGSFFMLLPLAVFGLFVVPAILERQKLGKVLFFLTSLLFILSLWLPTFIEFSSVTSFVSQSALPGVEDNSSREQAAAFYKRMISSYKSGLSSTVKIHPLLVLLSIVSLYLLKDRRLRNLFFLTIFWLLLLSFLGNAIKPQLELHRMALPLSFLLVLLSGIVVERLLEIVRQDNTNISRLSKLCALCAVFVMCAAAFLTPYVAYAAYTNQTDEKYAFAPEEFFSLAEAMRTSGDTGRVFFTGFLLHEMGTTAYDTQDGGHIAPLPIFSSREIYAADFYHRHWEIKDPIPQSFRKRGFVGIEEFLDLLNVTSVVTFKREWRDYCKKHPEVYTEIFYGGRFRLFLRKGKVHSFLKEGSGTVKRKQNMLEYFPDVSGSNRHVLRYRYLPQLKVSPDTVKITPVPAFPKEKAGDPFSDIDFIALEIPTDVSRVEIGF